VGEVAARIKSVSFGRWLILASLFAGFARTQPPSHSAGDAKDQSGIERVKEVSPSEKRSVASSPVQKTAADEKELAAATRSPTDKLIAWSAALSAMSTLFIALLGLAQWTVMRAQRSVMDKQAAYMRDSLTETTKAADAASDSANAAKLSADVALESFRSARRPRLVVKGMWANGIDNPLDSGSVTGNFLAFNFGETNATLSKHYSEVIVARELPAMIPSYGLYGEYIKDCVVPPGQGKPVSFPTKPCVLAFGDRKHLSDRGVEFQLDGQIIANARNVYVIGWIEYVEESGRSRRLAFCRIYDFHSRRFRVHRDDDYEYGD
jgi:hypothetical protein